jgi:hypothetical protein
MWGHGDFVALLCASDRVEETFSMTILSAGVSALASAALLLSASAAVSAEAQPADVPVATASGPARSVAEQIDHYLATSPAVQLPPERAPGVIPSQDEYERQIHGEVSVAVGTGGYRSAYVRSDIPVGKNGTVSIALSETKNGRGYGGYDYGYGGYGYGGYGGYGPYDGMGYGGYGGDSRSVGIGLTLPGGAAATSTLGPDGREYAAGCGRRGVGERRIAGINELVVEPGRGRCAERWMGDPLDR